MAPYSDYLDRMVRASSIVNTELPGGYDFLGRRFLRARSALPESFYEKAYESSPSRSLSRAMSQVREQSVSSYRRAWTVALPEESPIIVPVPIIQRVESKQREFEEMITPVRDFRASDALFHAKITIRKRDNYWQRRYMDEIANAKPQYVVRPQVVVQRPVVYYPPPPAVKVPEPYPVFISRTPRTYETVRTYQRTYPTTYRYYNQGLWGSYPRHYVY